MPARSNLLQRVIFHVQRELAGPATVEESALLPDRLSDSLREVDVVIRSAVADHEVVVAVECQDHSRKATVEWVEQMAMKHTSLPTSKLVLVARKGFTKAARAKATSLHIDVYSFDSALAEEAVAATRGMKSFELWAFRTLACSLVLRVDPGVEYAAGPLTPMFGVDGRSRGTLGEVVRKATEQSDKFHDSAQEFASREGDGVIGAEIRPKGVLMALDAAGERHEVEHIRVYLEIRRNPERTTLASASYRGLPVAYGSGESPAGPFTITFVERPGGVRTGVFSVTDAETGAVRTVNLRIPPEGANGKFEFITDPVHRIR